MSLAETIEKAEVVDGVRVVWDCRDVNGGTRLQVEPSPLEGHRALMQDQAGRCVTAWVPDGSELDACNAVLDMYLDILNR